MEQAEAGKIKVSRTYDAPLELLWQAWSEAEHFMKWYGPKGFTTPACEIDFRVGGKHSWMMQSSDGMQMHYFGSYKEISPMDSIVYSDSMADAQGKLMDPVMMGLPTPPKQRLASVTNSAMD